MAATTRGAIAAQCASLARSAANGGAALTFAIVGVLYAVFLVIGWIAARKVKQGSAEDLVLAGRAMPLWIATLTMTATWVDGGYLLGTAEGAYSSSLVSGLQGGV